MSGHFEQEALKAASAALELSPDPRDRCHSQLLEAKSHLALCHLSMAPLGPSGHAWPNQQPETTPEPHDAAKVSQG